MSRPPLDPLPIDDVLPQFLTALRGNGAVLLQAETGAGKTTRVPPAILDAGLTASGRILMLEPRRIAARAAAARMAAECGQPVGEEIGYQVRFEQRLGPRTRIQVVTGGVLIGLLQGDPFLERFEVIIFDEFHERSLENDLGLAMVRRVQAARPDLKIVVMSATLEPGPLAEFLGGAPVITSAGRLHPVAVQYQPPLPQQEIAVSVTNGVRTLLEATPGDLLVFLPGVGEIRRTARAMESLAGEQNLVVQELYGDLPAAEQDAVLAPAASRKVVLATNVAETSLTIPGITGVVDTGLARQLRFDAGTGLDQLVLGRISKAAAEQRKGRAGRTAPGICLRLWSEREQQGLTDQHDPEIRRVDLSGALLQLATWGECDFAAFPWFEPPPPASLKVAVETLERLGVLHEGRPTATGRILARWPIAPRLGRLLLAGHHLGITRHAALAAALLAERDPFLRDEVSRSGPRRAKHRSLSDLADRVAALIEFEQTNQTATDLGPLNPAAARFVLRARDQLLRLVQEEPVPADSPRAPAEEALRRALLAAFPDRVARRREAGGNRGVMIGGRGVRVGDRSAVTEAELFVCVALDQGGTESFVTCASAIERDWLDPAGLRTATETEFDEATEKVISRRRTWWEDLLLEDSPTAPVDEQAVYETLLRAARIHWERALPLTDPEVVSFLARIELLRRWMPELNWPLLDETAWQAVLPSLCAGCRSFADLRRAPLAAALEAQLTSAQRQALERDAPLKITVPSGNRISLVYEPGRPPVLAARIQELFGWAETPRIAGGRVPVLLHLLAPNNRPQQVTDDLRSFWNNTYVQVRKDLRRRYPKHAWPDDPWSATAQKRPGRPP